MQSSMPPLLAAVALFFAIYVIDWFLTQSASYIEKRSLMSDEEMEAGLRRHKEAPNAGLCAACCACISSCFKNYICMGVCVKWAVNKRKQGWRWLRKQSRIITWIGVSILVLVAIIALVARIASPTVLMWLVLCLSTMMYFVLHDIYLVLFKSGSKHVREMGVIPSHFVLNYLRAVHMVVGAIIIAPLYLLSIFPFTNQLHNQLLFNDIFAAKADNDYHLKRVVNKKGD